MKMKSKTFRFNEIECAILRKALEDFVNRNSKNQFNDKIIKYALTSYHKLNLEVENAG